MASALDKQLNEYKTRPADESGARRTKASLIYDPKAASFINSDTFYQIGYQGFSKLCTIDERFADFGSSIFSYNNIQIDPLFLTAEENAGILEKVENLLYLLSDYAMLKEASQVLEYLIQQFAVNRLRPAHLILAVLPYLETSFFVRVIQTIQFKKLSHDFKFLKDFNVVSVTKRPLNRKDFRDMINSRPELIHWITRHAINIAEIHPNGAFASFVGVLFTELALTSENEVIIRSIVDTCINSLESEDKALAPYTLMAVAALNEKKPLNEKILNIFAENIFSSTELLHSNFRSTLMAAIYFSGHSNVSASIDFIIALGHHIEDLDDISKEYKFQNLAENCIYVIAQNISNDDLIRSTIAILETDFFCDVALLLIREITRNYVNTEFSEDLIQSIASHYPTCLTSDVISRLNEINIKIKPSQILPKNLINQLSNPKSAASFYSNPDLPFEIASSQVVSSLASAEASGITDPIIPIIDYFADRAPEDLIQYFVDSLLKKESEFSTALKEALSNYGEKIAPFFQGIPTNSNSEILEHLSKYELPNIHAFPFALSKAIYKNDIIEAIQFLPIKNMNFDQVRELAQEKIISIESNESKAATILHIIEEYVEKNVLSHEGISLLLNFPDLRCIAPILKKIKDQSSIFAVFETSEPTQKRLRVNFLNYMAATCQKFEDVSIVLPSLFMALLQPEFVDIATRTLKSVPIKNKDVKVVMTHVLRQSQAFKTDEQTLCSVFNNAAKNPKSRDFFDKLWSNIQTPNGCALFWRLTHDIGVIPILHKFEDSPEIAQILYDVFTVFPEDTDLQNWAMNSLRPALMRAAIPFLPLSAISQAIPVVCAFPKYFSEAFASFFHSYEIDANILIPFLKENPSKLLPAHDGEPPEKLRSNRLKSKYVISPSSLILELIPSSKKITNLQVILPSLFGILKSHKSHHLIFPILNMCLSSSADYMIKNFNVIIDSLSHSPIPHIHLSALKLVQQLANRDPTSIAKHTTSLFNALSTSTIFVDDTANLVKIKQILSSVLPVLAKTDSIHTLLDYFSINIENFSVERASQIMLHSLNVLGDNSFMVFQSLLNNNKSEFALLLVDQMEPMQMMTSLINLLQSDSVENVVEFIVQITLPALPAQLHQLFELLEQKMDISSYIDSTFEAFSLQDFINVIVAFLPSNIEIYSYFHKRVVDEPSPLFVALLQPLKQELDEYHTLHTNLSILAEVAPCLTSEQSSQLIPIIQLIINSVDSGKYSVQNRVQALCFMASAIEKFNLVLFEAFPHVIAFAVNLYTKIVAEKIEAFVSSTTASVILLVKTSVNCCMDCMKDIWTNMLSPFVINSPELYSMVEDSLSNTTRQAQVSDLLPAFIVSFKDHKLHPNSLVLLFKAFSNSMKNSEFYSIKSCFERIMKFFFISFAVSFDDWEINNSVQDSIIFSFCVFLTQLDISSLKASMRATIDLLNSLMVKGKEDYVSSRFLFAKLMSKVTNGLEKSVDNFYEQLLQKTIEILGDDADDADFLKRQVTQELLELFQNITRYASDNLFNADYFNQSLNVLMNHVSVVVESTEEYIQKVMGYLAPSFGALLDTTKDDTLWRAANQKIIELMKNSDYRVRVAALQITEKAFDTVGSELTTILPELAPFLYELTEDSQNGVDQVARLTITKIESSIDEEIQNYFQ
ncbi:hypothetical protein TRFO_11193 [Tritrichomonas foetus]|uniref:HEAT repeat-containing protein 1 n=1 Tax=Tritrichomonas foetus TaxID=1144522 RepID=A0A1J4J4S7_9EUKA|nr:hypothetical protein TRFO_11193 [Tritrichomonas foetus]|eukprot:OHS94336.1 hypothetical protein TRFO_11193 [Tritrichomonas foetus]